MTSVHFIADPVPSPKIENAFCGGREPTALAPKVARTKGKTMMLCMSPENCRTEIKAYAEKVPVLLSSIQVQPGRTFSQPGCVWLVLSKQPVKQVARKSCLVVFG